MTGVVLQSVFATDPSLAFIFFIAFSLMTVLGLRFSFYAFQNLAATDLEAQEQLWEYLLLVGAAAALYGLLGVVETASAVTRPNAVVRTPYRDGVLLAFLLLLSLTMREIYYSQALSNEDPPEPFAQQRTVETSFGLLVTTTLFGSGLLGVTTILTVLEGVSAVAVAGYGLVYGSRQLNRSSVRGTMIDSLLRHLLPVVTFGVLVLVVDLTIPIGLTVEVARHIQVVFVIMTATALMTSTIKLRQNVTGY